MGDDASACDTGNGDDDNDKNRWCEGSPDDDDNGDNKGHDDPYDVDVDGAGVDGGDGSDGGDCGDGGDGGDGGTIWRVRLSHYKGGAGLLLIFTINHNWAPCSHFVVHSLQYWPPCVQFI